MQVTSTAPSSYSCIITTGIAFQINFEKLLHLTKYGRSIPHLFGHIPPGLCSNRDIHTCSWQKISMHYWLRLFFQPSREYTKVSADKSTEWRRTIPCLYQETPSLFRLVFLAVSRIVSVNNHHGYKTVSSCSVSSSCKTRVSPLLLLCSR